MRTRTNIRHLATKLEAHTYDLKRDIYKDVFLHSLTFTVAAESKKECTVTIDSFIEEIEKSGRGANYEGLSELTFNENRDFWTQSFEINIADGCEFFELKVIYKKWKKDNFPSPIITPKPRIKKLIDFTPIKFETYKNKNSEEYVCMEQFGDYTIFKSVKENIIKNFDFIVVFACSKEVNADEFYWLKGDYYTTFEAAKIRFCTKTGLKFVENSNLTYSTEDAFQLLKNIATIKGYELEENFVKTKILRVASRIELDCGIENLNTLSIVDVMSDNLENYKTREGDK